MQQKPSLLAWAFVVLGLVFLVLGSLDIVSLKGVLGENAPRLFLYVLLVIAGLHIIEASIAFYLAKKKQLNAWLWAGQTLVLGMFALRYLLK